jgi:hypothetical protein
MRDLTDKFALESIDHDELLHFLSLYYVSAWCTKELDKRLTTDIALPASKQFALRLRYKQGRITRIFRGPALSKQHDLDTLLEAIRVNCSATAIKEYGRGLLMVSRPVRGSYRAATVPLQILPPTDDLPSPREFHGQNPVVIEFPIRSWQREGMQVWRRYKLLTEWAWVLNALLSDSVRVEGSRPSKAWVFDPADQSYLYAQKMFPPLGGPGIIAALSPAGHSLPVVPAGNYYADWGSAARANLPLDELVVPDDLDQAFGKFDALQGIERHRFLSAAAIVYVATSS